MLSASVICADLLCLERDLGLLRDAGLDFLHFDLMDGNFVPGFGLSTRLLSLLSRRQPIPVEAHLMVTNPEKHVAAVADAGALMITFHYEAQPKAGKVAEKIRQRGLKAGVALNPQTPVSAVEPFLDALDLVLLMCYTPPGPSREPLPATRGRVEELRDLALARGRSELMIALDGGLGEKQIASFRSSGANFFVLGTTGLFKPGVRLDAQLERVRAAAK
jgi:ribulose-phosphate 3-epimerase